MTLMSINSDCKDKFDSLLNNSISSTTIQKNRIKFINNISNINLLKSKIIKHSFYYLLKKYLNIDEELPIIFKYSKKLTETAGSFNVYEDDYGAHSYELIISYSIIKSLFTNEESALEVSGIYCKNKLECFAVLMEHEFIHFLISYCNYSDWKNGMHSKKFRLLMKNMFNHTQCTHSLLLGDAGHKHNEQIKINNIKKSIKINNIYSLVKNNEKLKKILLLKINPKKALVKNIDDGNKYKISYLLFDV
jgi:hypothetical protein